MIQLSRSAAIPALSLLLGIAVAQSHSQGDEAMKPGITTPAEIEWLAGPPALPAGAHFAVLEGDPAKEGAFTMRLRMPDGYKIPPHTHPQVEHVTIISGTFNLGMGAKFDQAASRAMPTGTFGYWPAGMQHFAWAQGETVVQVHGTGPWGIDYVDPADDPRKAK